MSWEPGRERVRDLIDAGEVNRVTQTSLSRAAC